MPQARRSNRLSGARKKYTEVPIASEDSESNSVIETEKPSRIKGKKPVHGDSSDDEFQVPPGEEEGDVEDDDDDSQDEDVVPENGDEEVKEEEVFSAEDAPTRARSKAPNTPQPRYSKKRQSDGTIALTGGETHSRGTWNPLEHVAKSIHLQVTFGLDERDILAILYARDRWDRGIDSGFPTRASLDEAQTAPDYTYGSTFGLEPEDLKRESTHGWDWYYSDDGGERFRKRQRIERIEEKDARQTYMPAAKEGKHTVLVGPADDQKVFTLEQHESVNFGDAWPEIKAQANPHPNAKSPGLGGPGKKKRQGWIVNIGSRIQCMAWAPNQPGINQYLAVVAPISKGQKKAYPDPLRDHSAPAFRPSAPYPCALQLWAFKAEKGNSVTRSIDMTFKPRLRLALCTNWGDLRRMAWCPMPREPREEDEEDVLRNVGLLAGIWGDGFVRVIDVKLSRDPNKTDFYRVDSAVFEAKLPSTVCTCLSWLSPSDLAVGCANGFVAVWNIAPQSKSEVSQGSGLPYFYQPIHSTYVLSISSAYPTYPHLVGTTSMDGETRLSSLLDFQKDTVETTRMRVGSPFLSYSPWLQSFVSSDENDFVRLLTVRRFFTTTAIARVASTVSALATCSSWHPSILLGCTGGSVITTNPLRRLLHAKEKQWQQTWFSHTWVRGKELGSSGTSRFIDGYRAESISLLRNMMGDRKLVNGTMVITIFEEETHVTALAWNPNQPCAGWASAGLGCGLVRIEDVAI